jgi:hypothetical protein
MTATKRPLHIVFGYSPLFTPDPTDAMVTATNATEKLAEYGKPVDIKAASMFRLGDGVGVGLVMDHARAIFEHLTYYSENNPAGFFEFVDVVTTLPSGVKAYGICIWPIQHAIIARHGRILLHQTETFVPQDVEYKVFMNPLRFYFRGDSSYYYEARHMLPAVGRDINVAFLTKPTASEQPMIVIKRSNEQLAIDLMTRDMHEMDAEHEKDAERAR